MPPRQAGLQRGNGGLGGVGANEGDHADVEDGHHHVTNLGQRTEIPYRPVQLRWLSA